MFDKFKIEIQSNLSIRLKEVEEKFNRLMKNKDAKKIFRALRKLDKQSNVEFYKLCDTIMITNFDSIEGMESILSFISNFIDDSFFKLEENLDAKTFKMNIATRCGISMEKFENSYNPEYNLVGGGDNGISTKELIEHINLLIKKENDWVKNMRKILGN